MADNKTQPTKLNVADFLAAIPDDSRRADAKALAKLLQATTGEKPKMWGPAIVGFGAYHYVYDSGREGDMPIVGFSPRKAATVLYGLGLANDDGLLPKLGKHTTGKGCLYVKRLADIDQEVLRSMAARAFAAKRSGA